MVIKKTKDDKLRIKSILIILFVFCTSCSAQNDSAKVTIKVSSINLHPSTEIYISGNKDELGNWQPNVVQLERKDNFWEMTFQFDLNTSLEFKFTKGSWESQALNNDGEIPSNNIINVNQDTTLTYTINYWNNGNTNIPVDRQITGKVVTHKQITYTELLPRDVFVWLPPEYDVNTNQKYPVLYMHDGQNLFDPKTSYSKIDWQLDEAADSLIRNNKIWPMIIVGISNTVERSAEYTPSQTNILYKKFVVEKLKPFIDSTYRTLSDRENTYVGGSSSGGTISFMFLWEYSNIFSKAACFSPAFVTKHFNYTEQIKDDNLHRSFKLYIDNGGLGVDAELQPGIALMIKTLENKGYKEGKDYIFVLDKEAEHNETAWAKRVPHMLKTLFTK